MEDLEMYSKVEFTHNDGLQKSLVNALNNEKNELFLFEVPKNFDKSLLNQVEFTGIDHAINDEYSIKNMQDVPHLNSVCMMLNKDKSAGKLEGGYKFNRYYKIARSFAPNSKKKFTIHKKAVKSDVVDTDDTTRELKKVHKKHKKDKSQKKVKKDKKEKKDKKSKKEKKSKKSKQKQ